MDDTKRSRDVRPQQGPQEAFLASPADVVVYGGAAGGGKTFGLLLDAIRYVSNPDYGFVIFRRTSPQITNEGGLWDESMKLYPHLRAQPVRGILTWRFPSGAKGAFRHLQHKDNVLAWQGAQVAYIGFDELTHFEESQFFYMLSRNRSTSGVRPCIRATTNPAPGWVKTFLSPWLDKGYDNPARSGEIRWFIRKQGEIVWVDEDYRDEDGHPPKSVTFIRSSIYDNRILLDANPEYLTNLKSLPLVDQARLLHGDWDVFEGAFFNEWSDARHTDLPMQPGEMPRHWSFFGGLDWGYAAPFAFVLCASDEAGTVRVIEECYHRNLTNEQQADRVRAVLSKWGVPPDKCLIAADPAMWSKRTVNGIQGEPDIEAFHRAGLACAQADNNRQHGWSRIRAWLHAAGPEGDARFRAWKGTCPNLIRTFPLAVYDTAPNRLEDLDTEGDDHVLDALRYALMSRPQPSGPDPAAAPKTSRYDEELLGTADPAWYK